jgi:hypothetical protein
MSFSICPLAKDRLKQRCGAKTSPSVSVPRELPRITQS